MIERVLYLEVVSMDAESAKAFFGREDEPIDLGPPSRPEKYKEGARVWGFPREPKNAEERAAIKWRTRPR